MSLRYVQELCRRFQIMKRKSAWKFLEEVVVIVHKCSKREKWNARLESHLWCRQGIHEQSFYCSSIYMYAYPLPQKKRSKNDIFQNRPTFGTGVTVVFSTLYSIPLLFFNFSSTWPHFLFQHSPFFCISRFDSAEA